MDKKIVMGKNNIVFNHSKINNAKKIEDILCLAVLIANKELLPDATLEESDTWFNSFKECGDCPHADYCLACIINE